MACGFCGRRVVPNGNVCNDRPGLGIGACESCDLVQVLDPGHVDESLYAQADYFPADLDPVRARERHWNAKRIAMVRALIADAKAKTVLDFGCGSGGFLEQGQDAFARLIGFDLSRRVVEDHRARGWRCVNALDEVPDSIDVITLFHVLEHVAAPWALLAGLRRRFVHAAHFVIEVPNTAEALNTIFENAAYGRNHFNSEHVYYFTAATLRRMVERAGLEVVIETQLQRYTLANTFGWLVNGRGGGQDLWPRFNDPALNQAWEAVLTEAGVADSLFFVCRPRS